MTERARYNIPKGFKVVVEMIDREKALSLLENAAENRSISPLRVASYRQLIERGEWHSTNQGIGIRDDGKLVDGQHRLWAIAESGIPVPMTITYGLKPDAVEAIDKGRTRSIGDELTMFEGLKNANFTVATVKQCAKLYHGDKIVLTTRAMFHEWYDQFRDGVNFIVENMTGAPNEIRRAPVTGSLAFAFKGNPDKISEFALKLKEGTGLVKGEPAWALRRGLIEGQYAKRMVSVPGPEVARKVLRAAQMHLRGEKLGTLQDSEAGLIYFKKFYEDSRKLKSLVQPFKAVAGEKNLKHEQSAAKAAQALSGEAATG